MPENEVERRRKRLQTLCDGLLAARDEADDLHAYLLAAKIEDSRLCAQGMIAALR